MGLWQNSFKLRLFRSKDFVLLYFKEVLVCLRDRGWLSNLTYQLLRFLNTDANHKMLPTNTASVLSFFKQHGMDITFLNVFGPLGAIYIKKKKKSCDNPPAQPRNVLPQFFVISPRTNRFLFPATYFFFSFVCIVERVFDSESTKLFWQLLTDTISWLIVYIFGEK